MVNREETYLRSDAGELLPLDAIGYDSEEATKRLPEIPNEPQSHRRQTGKRKRNQ